MAYVSVMRGCNNMCSFCIVPFTRGRDKSRPVESIVKEVGELWEKVIMIHLEVKKKLNQELSEGFKSILDRLSTEFPDMRFRYTSPHPKDFPADIQ
ncbi:hypothetical protein GQ457_06G000090 [Hibiscus cannabinus]